MGVTVVTAADRDHRSTTDRARRLDARHAVLAATSLFAVFAITLALVGRVRGADAAADRSQPAVAAINLNAVTDSSELVPVLAPVFTDASDRRSAATHLHRFIMSRA